MRGLGRELARSLAGTGMVPRLVADGPSPAWRLGELTLVVGRERAHLRYARAPVGWCKPTATDIAAAAKRAIDRLEARSREPDVVLAELARAYAAIVARTGARRGDRVALVAIRDELGRPRAQFAWDLARLQRLRRLAIDGARIDLGVATGHATARASRVVFLESPHGGTFYETFRLLDHEERR